MDQIQTKEASGIVKYAIEKTIQRQVRGQFARERIGCPNSVRLVFLEVELFLLFAGLKPRFCQGKKFKRFVFDFFPFFFLFCSNRTTNSRRFPPLSFMLSFFFCQKVLVFDFFHYVFSRKLFVTLLFNRQISYQPSSPILTVTPPHICHRHFACYL